MDRTKQHRHQLRTACTMADRSEPVRNLTTKDGLLAIFLPAAALMAFVFLCEVGAL